MSILATDVEIHATARDGWTHFSHRVGPELVQSLETYNDMARHLDLLHETAIDKAFEKAFAEGTADENENHFPPRPADIAGTHFVWMPKDRAAVMETPHGWGYMFWIATEWQPIDPATPGNPESMRVLHLADVRACVKGMNEAAYAEHAQWEASRAKH